MKLSEVKEALTGMNEVAFRLENGTQVPAHFHVTEVGGVQRHFIDCGGTMRKDQAVNFQLWTANDYDHRLAATKFLNIINLSEDKLGLEDADVQVEYQTSTIGIYGLSFDGNSFVLINTQTDCLAKEACDIPQEKQKVIIGEATSEGSCTPGGGCC